MNTVTLNVEREVALTLAGRVFPMLANWPAVKEIEEQVGSVYALAKRVVGGGSLDFREMSIIAAECIKAAGTDRSDPMLIGVNAQKVGELIFEEGLTKDVVFAFAAVLGRACTGNRPPKPPSDDTAPATLTSA